METFFSELWIARDALMEGFVRTIEASVVSILIGTALGLLIGIVLVYGPLVVRLLCRAYVDVMRGTPVLVLILASFYIPSVVGLHLSAFQAGLLALILFCGAHIGEIVRGALQSIPPGQTEAARSIGLTFPQILTYVLLPQALRSILPTWINTGAELVKASTLLSVIGVGELLLKTQEIVGRNFMTLDFYLFAGLLYLLVNLGIEQAGKALERRVAVR
ncbi:amino acid ABC transporter permease [Microvirga aerophila]|uniref:ABC transporter permease n=1 Tax=Microvirga aerophila TaxID=670291 RepID=A0A512C093_9HYPH|nr:amino acid ABC transporter permease [Microvirga aerophila]GEO17634.1 ABC transporter permease [Microvirga aerophila]